MNAMRRSLRRGLAAAQDRTAWLQVRAVAWAA